MPVVAKERVLLIDDEPQVLIALEDLLCDDFSVLTSRFPDKALNLLEQESDIAVIVTDQRMPNMSGDELLARLGPSCAAERILVTGFADLEAIIHAVNDGNIFAYVTKPWNEEDLRLKVQKAALQFRLARELDRERKLLHDLMDNVPDGVFFKTDNLTYVRANQAYAAMICESDPGHLLGKQLSEVSLSPEYAQIVHKEEQHLLRHGNTITGSVREYTRPSGSRWLAETKAPIRDPEGMILGVVGTVRDVTVQRKAEEALANSERRLREQTRVLDAILESMGEGVVVADPTGHLTLFNQRAKQLLGREPPSEARALWTNTLGLTYRSGFDAALSSENPLTRAVAGETTVEMDVLVQEQDTPERRLAVNARPVSDRHGEHLGGIVVLRDITQQRLLEEQLIQSQKMEAVGQLAGGIAHDFNNLLAVIMSYSQLVLDDLSENDPKRADIGEIVDASKRAAALTGQLLSFSRRRVLRPSFLNLNEVTADMEKMFRRVIGESIQLVTVLGRNLGSIHSDRNQVEQVLLNLVLNARDAMPSGGTLTIQTSNTELAPQLIGEQRHPPIAAGRYVLLSVTDTGTGMDAVTQRRVFEPFFTTKGVGKGTGLGLSTVYGIVKQSGGHVLLYSELGRGSSFKVYFPEVRSPSPTPSLAATSHETPSKLGKILLLEDDPVVRQVSARILRQHGHEVLEALNANDARRLHTEHRGELDLLLTDIVMPDISGPVLAREFVARSPELRVLYMTGYASASIPSDQLFQAGTTLLEKPFSPSTLLQAVERAMKSETEVDYDAG